MGLDENSQVAAIFLYSAWPSCGRDEYNKSGMVLVYSLSVTMGGPLIQLPVQRTGIEKTAIRAIKPY